MSGYHISIFAGAEDGGHIADVPGLVLGPTFGAMPIETLAWVLRARAPWIEAVQTVGRRIFPPRPRPSS